MRKMTQGSIARHLIAYALPLILGNLFQLTYNAVDSMKDIDDEVAYSTRASYQNYVQNGRAATEMLEEKDDGFFAIAADR